MYRWSGSNLVLVSSTDSYVLPTASSAILGGIKVGSSLAIDTNGVLDVPIDSELS